MTPEERAGHLWNLLRGLEKSLPMSAEKIFKANTAAAILAAVAEEQARCIRKGWDEVCWLEEHGTWPTEESFAAALRARP